MIMNSTLSLKISSHPKVKIDTIAEINPDRISPKSRPQRIKYVDIGNVDRGQILKYVEVDLEEAPSRAQRVVKPNDVIISTVRPGNQAYAFLKAVPESMVVSTGFTVLRAIGCDPRYLYYWLTSDPVIDYLASIADEKSAYPSINPSDIGDLEIPLPPLETQREIAHVLGTLDDKIELNRRMNKTLEEIAQALFKHWFIDFEFPNEEGKPYKSSGGKMVDSELGLIPKGWGVGGIEDMGTICGGSTPSTKNQKYWGGNTPFVTPKDLTSLTSLYLVSTERRITLDGVKRISSGVLPENTILLSSRAPIGYIALLIEPSSVNQGFIAIQCKNPRFIQYVLLWLSSNIDLIKQYANGSTFLEISKDNFRRIKIVIPGHDVIDEFNKCCVSLFTLMKHTTLALSQLVQIRQQLLVYLINSI